MSLRRPFGSRCAAIWLLAPIVGWASGMTLLAPAAFAQAQVQMPEPRPNPLRVPPPPTAEDAQPLNLLPGAAGAPLDLLPPAPPAIPLPPQDVLLVALLIEGGLPIPEGIDWRVFADRPGPDGIYPLVATARGGAARVRLVPGAYRVHAAYGRAGVAARIAVGPEGGQQTIVLNAGGLRLQALVGDDLPIPRADLRFEVYGAADATGERPMIADNAAPDEILRLNAGGYQVISYYSDTNAIVRADVNITAGILTDVTLYHQAARVTLKLVTVRGGEALANTVWSVLSEGGEIIFDSDGAFPSVVLAAGTYTAIAKHGEDIFQSPFTVASGVNRDVEVLTQSRIQPAAAAP